MCFCISDSLSVRLSGSAGLSPAQLSAAEVVSALLLEEMRQMQPVGEKMAQPGGHGGQPQRGISTASASAGASAGSLGLEEACSRAALRLVHTAMRAAGDAQVGDIAPLSALGDPAALRELVARTQGGAALAEDVSLLREEKRRLDDCVAELKSSLAAMDKRRHEKDDLVLRVNAECAAAKERGRQALLELQSLADQMLVERGEAQALGQAKAALERELTALGRKAADLSSLGEMEAKALVGMRARLSAARGDTDRWEQRAQEARGEADGEESRIQSTKAAAGDQLKLLQQELTRIQADLKAGRRSAGDLEKIRLGLDGDILRRRAEAEAQAAARGRELDEALRRATVLGAEQREMQADVDRLALNKRQVWGVSICRFANLLVFVALSLFAIILLLLSLPLAGAGRSH
jgi:hypothetical protein